MASYYLDDQGGYHGITEECPPKFKGVLFVGRGGKTPDTVHEQVYALNVLQKMASVPVSDVPDEWLLAIGYDAPLEPEPEPLPEPEINFYGSDPDRQVIDITWWPFAGSTPPAKPQTAEERFWQDVVVLGMALIFILYKILTI